MFSITVSLKYNGQLVVQHLLTATTRRIDVAREDFLSRRTFDTTYKGACYFIGPSLDNI